MSTLTLRADDNSFAEVLALVARAVANIKACYGTTDSPRATLEKLFDSRDLGPKLIRFEVADVPAVAGELVVLFQPTDLLRGLAAACGASDIDRLIIEKCHG